MNVQTIIDRTNIPIISSQCLSSCSAKEAGMRKRKRKKEEAGKATALCWTQPNRQEHCRHLYPVTEYEGRPTDIMQKVTALSRYFGSTLVVQRMHH